jgi:hypothetical protein
VKDLAPEAGHRLIDRIASLASIRTDVLRVWLPSGCVVASWLILA